MNVEIILNNEENVPVLKITNSLSPNYVNIELVNTNVSNSVSIEDLKHSLRKISTK